ncbi:helix-turn-helix domain-containing protein [uncultured Roseovarius sp.]|uniref:AlbA family DNA-binding domain-containing protein n=1 Tax=uncultured Roseovarius sp. TaxID=293344 RepID=UPI0025E4AE77|nr:ATP-binding protein [uncultured Roseovarius sp.]
MEEYTPFLQKQFPELCTRDLENLRTVNEGWYVEYKSEVSNPKTIAKSVSSFANTYGGWVFYGVHEKGNGDNSAGQFVGIPKSEMDAALQKIRQSVASNLNPIPHFETKVFSGPAEGINLPEDRVVICIRVPISYLAPHIHSNGCIYRRVADSSEPKPESDRHQLDVLWRRREKIDSEYADWIKRAPERTRGEAERPYLRLLLDADICQLEEDFWQLSVNDVMGVFNDSNNGLGIPVDSCYPSHRGIVARQTSSLTNHADFGLTWIIGKGLRSEVWIPLNVHATNGKEPFVQEFAKYQNTDFFYELLETSKVTDGKIVDLNQLFQILVAVLNQFDRLLDKNGTSKRRIHGKIILSGIWHLAPFIDAEIILTRMKFYGLPLCLNAEGAVPEGFGADSFYEFVLGEQTENPSERSVIPSVHLMDLVCQAFGVQTFLGSTKDEINQVTHQLLDAANRVKQVNDR